LVTKYFWTVCLWTFSWKKMIWVLNKYYLYLYNCEKTASMDNHFFFAKIQTFYRHFETSARLLGKKCHICRTIVWQVLKLAASKLTVNKLWKDSFIGQSFVCKNTNFLQTFKSILYAKLLGKKIKICQAIVWQVLKLPASKLIVIRLKSSSIWHFETSCTTIHFRLLWTLYLYCSKTMII
jgi:hypothetical protein